MLERNRRHQGAMETPGNQVDETVEQIETLALNEQGVEAGDAEETQLTRVETGDAEETQLTGVEPGDAGETARGRDRAKEEHEQTSGASGGENSGLQRRSKNSGLQRKVLLLTLLQAEKLAKKVFEGVDTGEAAKTQLAGVETKDPGGNQKGHDRSEEEDNQVSGASRSENNPLQGVKTKYAGETELTGVKIGDAGETRQGRNCDKEEKQISGAGAGRGENNFKFYQLQGESNALLRAAKYSEALENLKRLLEMRPNDVKTMLQLAECHIMIDEAKSAMDVARKIKAIILEQPRAEVQDLMLAAQRCESVGNYPSQLIFLWCACWLADRDQSGRADTIGDCLDRMSAVGKDLADDIEQRVDEFASNSLDKLGSLLYLLNDDLEVEVEALQNFDEDLFAKLSIRCLSNKASGLLQQHRFGEGIQLYKTCIEKLSQRHGPNATKQFMMGEFLTVIGFVHIFSDAASPAGWKKLREARTAVLDAPPTSAFEERSRDIILRALNGELGPRSEEERSESGDLEEASASALDKKFANEPEWIFLKEKKEKFASAFRAFLRKYGIGSKKS